MGECNPELKVEEQFPLLKIDGGGDPSLAPAPGWGVKCSQSPWLSRWPECLSTCWMTTLALLGISGLVSFALCLSSYHQQQSAFAKRNGSSPAADVYYHQIVPMGAQIPFLRLSEYLASMATQHRHLQFNVLFLIEDSYAGRAQRSHRLIDKLVPYSYLPYYGHMNVYSDDNNIKALVDFQKSFRNVNVTIMSLSKYMAGTTLRFKWRAIPLPYLPFYIRVHSVWENGGIAIDSAYHSFFDNDLTSRRKLAILKQHNDGMIHEAYADELNKIDNYTAVLDLFFSFMNRLLNETCSFLIPTSPNPLTSEPKSELLVRTHRAKREIDSVSAIETTTTPSTEINSTVDDAEQNNSSSFDMPKSPLYLLSRAFEFPAHAKNVSDNKTEAAVVIIYDFQIVSDSLGPSSLVAAAPAPVLESVGVTSGNVGDARLSMSYLLSMNSEGTFIAAPSRQHPFLGHLLSAGCLRLAPRFAIQAAHVAQCAGVVRDVYCDNIYIM